MFESRQWLSGREAGNQEDQGFPAFSEYMGMDGILKNGGSQKVVEQFFEGKVVINVVRFTEQSD